MIQVEHVNKTYKVARRSAGFSEAVRALFHREVEYVHALNDITFTIGDGEMVGYIGPNGAGKSSTIKILSGILTPDSGTCLIDGRVPWKERKEHVKRSASYSASARSSGGTYPSSIPSNFSAISTKFPSPNTKMHSTNL